MDAQPTIEKWTTYFDTGKAKDWGLRDSDGYDAEGGLLAFLGDGTFSLFPGSDWYRFGGVAIQADPCGTCEGSGYVASDPSRVDTTDPLSILLVDPCPKCRGLGVIPRHGSIERLPAHWSKTNEDGSFSGGFIEKRCVVVPIEGDERFRSCDNPDHLYVHGHDGDGECDGFVVVEEGHQWSGGRDLEDAVAAPKEAGWWAISGEALLSMLRRVAAGEEPDLVYAEEYANSDHEAVEGDE